LSADVSEERLATIVEKTMIKFGDQLFIQHAPMVQQEGKIGSYP
jgi:hypothetical protein